LEINIGNYTFGRQIGSYPILVCIPYKLDVNKFVNVKIIDHSYRSVTAIEYPLKINVAPFSAIKNIPEIGEKLAVKIVRNRPIKSVEELTDLIKKDISGYISLD